jgi:DUF971 family protein
MNVDEHEFPQSIIDHAASGELELVWQDGSMARLPHALPRARCRCAACEQQLRRSGQAPEAMPDIRLAAVHLVGDKGLNLRFSDGHGRGIYPWAHLRQIAREHSANWYAPVPLAIAGIAPAPHA